jgi:hypothetical protein
MAVVHLTTRRSEDAGNQEEAVLEIQLLAGTGWVDRHFPAARWVQGSGCWKSGSAIPR